jgi:hypothetical protein
LDRETTPTIDRATQLPAAIDEQRERVLHGHRGEWRFCFEARAAAQLKQCQRFRIGTISELWIEQAGVSLRSSCSSLDKAAGREQRQKPSRRRRPLLLRDREAEADAELQRSRLL